MTQLRREAAKQAKIETECIFNLIPEVEQSKPRRQKFKSRHIRARAEQGVSLATTTFRVERKETGSMGRVDVRPDPDNFLRRGAGNQRTQKLVDTVHTKVERTFILGRRDVRRGRAWEIDDDAWAAKGRAPCV